MAKKISKSRGKLLIYALVLILIAVNYSFFDKSLNNLLVDYEVGVVERVIDGDTIIVNGSSVRLLGINTPERGEEYYEEAKLFLENLSFGKLVRMEKSKEDKDLYNRSLRYIFVEDKNVNLWLVENGFANYYFPSGKDRHYKDFKNAWERCLDKEINLCEHSKDKCGKCITLKKLDVNSQEVVLKNNCNVECNLKDWSIKDEGRKIFVFPEFTLKNEAVIRVGEGKNTENVLFWEGESYVWTKTGDTLFLRDGSGGLVLWWGY